VYAETFNAAAKLRNICESLKDLLGISAKLALNTVSFAAECSSKLSADDVSIGTSEWLVWNVRVVWLESTNEFVLVPNVAVLGTTDVFPPAAAALTWKYRISS
jgi:hypothetical protein